MALNASRHALRLATGAGRRQMSAEATHFGKMEHEAAHAAGATDTWKKISLFLCVPGLAAVTYKTFALDAHPPQMEFRPFAHLRQRKKMFPWGDGNHTLFHDDHVNALPEGYKH